MEKKIIYFLTIVLVLMTVSYLGLLRKNKILKQDFDRQTENVGSLNYSIQYNTLEDSLSVAKNKALQAKCEELKRLHLSDTKLIKELRVRLKDVKTIQTISSSTSDSVRIEPINSEKDSVFVYNDQWLSLHIDIPARFCQYTSRDSLTTIVSRIYKHKFLWWRWGTKGYQVQIINFNPHSKIKYSRYIEVVK